jgi:glutamine synthetase
VRALPWHEKTAFVTADLVDHHHHGIPVSPRQILKKQLERLDKAGMVALCGTELEFIVFNDTYEEAWNKRYNELIPANQYNVDYSLTGTSRVEKLLRAIRLGMDGANMIVESAKGECNYGQHEIAFRYQDALTTCDNHSIYKMGAKVNLLLLWLNSMKERETPAIFTFHSEIRRVSQSWLAMLEMDSLAKAVPILREYKSICAN